MRIEKPTYHNKPFRVILSNLIREEGTQANLAKKIGVSPIFVSHWINGYQLPAVKWALKLEKVYGIDRKISRPDIFDE